MNTTFTYPQTQVFLFVVGSFDGLVVRYHSAHTIAQ